MAMLDWSQCPAVESIPDKVGGVPRHTPACTRFGAAILAAACP